MSGSNGGGFMPRERREAMPQPVGVVDPDRDFGQVGQLLRRQSDQVAGVLDRAGDEARGELKKDSLRRGEEAAMAEPIARDADGRLVAPTAEELRVGPFTTAGEAQRRAVLANRYGSEFLLQGQAALVELRGKHRDPAAFEQAARGWREGILETLPPQMRGPVGEGLGRAIGQHFRDLAGERMREERQSAREASAAAGAQLATEYVDALRTPGADPGAALGRLLGKNDADLRDGVKTPAEHAAAARHATVVLPAIARATSAAGSGAGDFVRQMVPVESGGRDDARNPNSTATGRGQFIESTWLALVRREMPREIEGLSERQILDLRKNGALAERMALAHVERDLDPALRAAGVEPSNLARYAAWHFGPGAGPAVMKADDAAPMRGLLSAEAVAANPYLKDLTAGQWRARFAGKFSAGAGDGAPELLRTGKPGDPGWRPEWTSMTVPERAQHANYLDGLRTNARQEAAFQRAEGQREAVRQAGEIDWRVTEIEQAARRGGADGAGRAQTAAELAEIDALHERRRGLLAPYGGDNGAAVRASAGFAEAQERRTVQAELGAVVMAEGAAALEAHDPAAARVFQDGIKDKPIEVQVRLMERRVQQLGEHTRRVRAEADGDAAFMRGVNGLERLERSPANERRALQWVTKGQERPDLLDPAVRDRLMAVVAANALPEGMVTLGSALLRGGEPGGAQRFAALHEAMMADDRTSATWRANLGDRLAGAYSSVAGRLRGLDPDKPPQAAEIARIREQAARVAAGETIPREEVLRQFGEKAKQQDEALDALAAAPIGRVSSVPVPPALRDAMREAVIDKLRLGIEPADAAHQAWQDMQRGGWAVSRLAVGDLIPAQPLPTASLRARDRLLAAGIEPGEAPGDPLGERWVRHAPEAHPARYGAGGEKGTRWLEERMRDLARSQGAGEHGDLAPGRDVMLRPVLRGGELAGHKVMWRTRDGQWHEVMERDERGYATALPMLLDLRREAAAHDERWRRSDEGKARLAREAELERAGRAGTAAQSSPFGAAGAYGAGLVRPR